MAKRKRRKAKVDLRLYTDLTVSEDYARRLNEQGNRCALCGREPKGIKFSRDHNHRTMKIRGLLCLPCNRYILGAVERFRVRPDAIIKYFKAYDPENILIAELTNG